LGPSVSLYLFAIGRPDEPVRHIACIQNVTDHLPQPSPNDTGTLYPVYLRGQAYPLAHNGAAASAEFQKVLDHPGIVASFCTGALAHLQFARAQARSGDSANAKSAYQDFLALWKDADPDIPILLAAKSEYAKLK
jgi:hypothetical protein